MGVGFYPFPSPREDIMPTEEFQACVICGSPARLLTAPIMTSSAVCQDCYRAWYDTGITDKEELKAYVLTQRADKRFHGVTTDSQEVDPAKNGNE